jgi:hypothetical protein
MLRHLTFGDFNVYENRSEYVAARYSFPNLGNAIRPRNTWKPAALIGRSVVSSLAVARRFRVSDESGAAPYLACESRELVLYVTRYSAQITNAASSSTRRR